MSEHYASHDSLFLVYIVSIDAEGNMYGYSPTLTETKRMNLTLNKEIRIMGFVLMILFGIRAYAAEATLTIGNNKTSLASYEPVKGGKAGSALCIGYTINDAKNVCYGNALVHNREYILT